MTIVQASRTILEGYLNIIDEEITDAKKNKLQKLFLLKKMIETVLRNTSKYDNAENLMTEDKVSRWLGFIQGVLFSMNLLNIGHERDFSRELFHKAYEDSGIEKPKSLTATLDPIYFHITSMQELNDLAIKKYQVSSYKDLSEKKLYKIGFKMLKKCKPRVYKFIKKTNYEVEFISSGDKKYSFKYTIKSLKDA